MRVTVAGPISCEFSELPEHVLDQFTPLNEGGAEAEDLTARQTIVNDLAASRKSQGLTQTDLADRAGLKQSAISDVESHKHDSRLKTLEKLAAGLGRPLTLRLVRVTPSAPEWLNSKMAANPWKQPTVEIQPSGNLDPEQAQQMIRHLK